LDQRHADLTLSDRTCRRSIPLAGYSRAADAALPHQRRPGASPACGSSSTPSGGSDSDLTGDILIDETKKPEFLTAKLVSQHLVFADLAHSGRRAAGQDRQRLGAAEADPAASRSHRRSVSQRAAPYRAPAEAMNMDVTLDAKEGRRAGLSAGAGASRRVLINNGVATA
jgi:hypothetical protein